MWFLSFFDCCINCNISARKIKISFYFSEKNILFFHVFLYNIFMKPLKIISNFLFFLKIIYTAKPAYLIVVLFVSILNSISLLINVLFLGIIIDILSNSFFAFIMLICGVYCVSSSIDLLVLYLQKKILSLYYLDLVEQLKIDVFCKIDQFPYSKFEDKEFYNQLVITLEQVELRIQACIQIFESIISNSILLLSTIYLITKIDFIHLFIAIINIIISIYLDIKITNLEKEKYYSLNQISRELTYNEIIRYSSNATKELRAFPDFHSFLNSLYTRKIQKKSSYLKTYQHSVFQIDIKQAINSILFNIIILCSLGYKVFLSEILLSSFLVTYNAYNQFISSAKSMGEIVPLVYENAIYTDSFRSFMSSSSTNKSDKYALKMPIREIIFDNLSFIYPTSTHKALKNINLTIQQGQHIALVGRNGAGKSTIIKLLSGLYTSYEGRITVNNINIEFLDLPSLISIMFQEVNIYPFSIAENITLAPIENSDLNKVERILKQVGLWDKISSLPNLYNHSVTREFDSEGVYFSGGELQKIALARVLYKDSPIVIFDEPSSSIDAISEKQLFDLSLNLLHEKTIIFITHKLSNIKNMDYIYFIENGEVIEEGTHDDLLAKEGKYNSLFFAQ